jgi:hypothetical protein
MWNSEWVGDLLKNPRRAPVVAAVVTTGTVFGALGGIYLAIKEIFGLAAPPNYLFIHVLYWVLLLFFISLAAQYRSTRSRVGALGKVFEYDKEGVLWHGSEKAIAFRVVTFLSLLENLDDGKEVEKAQTSFLHAGRRAGRDFAVQFGSQIYPAELRRGGPSFDQLSKSQRLALWSEYDSSTGWGLLSAQEKPSSVEITVRHPTLFYGRGGVLFTYYLAGYCETVVNEITDSFGSGYHVSNNIARHGKIVSFLLVLGESTAEAHDKANA